MMSTHYQAKNPVALFVFNRPKQTRQVFERVRMARPRTLLVVADGSRADRAGEAELCSEVRKIVQQVDWECEVKTHFSDHNLGCRKRMASGVTWVFQQVEQAILLEDDCLPSEEFFQFCDELLDRYKDDERVMHISGSCYDGEAKTGIQKMRREWSYRFSSTPYIWGWASWRRAWRFYDEGISLWPIVKQQEWLADFWKDSMIERVWTRKFNQIWNGFDTWDYQWTFACNLQRGLCIIPRVNLISNIGFGEGATHTKVKSVHAEMKAGGLEFPLKHPPFCISDHQSDLEYMKKQFGLVSRIKNQIKIRAHQAGLLK